MILSEKWEVDYFLILTRNIIGNKNHIDQKERKSFIKQDDYNSPHLGMTFFTET